MPALQLLRQLSASCLPANTDLLLVFCSRKLDPLHVAFLQEKNGSEESSSLCCVASTVADRTLRLDVANGAGAAAPGKARSSRCRSIGVELPAEIEIEVADKGETCREGDERRKAVYRKRLTLFFPQREQILELSLCSWVRGTGGR